MCDPVLGRGGEAGADESLQQLCRLRDVPLPHALLLGALQSSSSALFLSAQGRNHQAWCRESCLQEPSDIGQGKLPTRAIRHGTSRKAAHRSHQQKQEEAETGGPDAGFFCTSVFLTPQPVAALESNRNQKEQPELHTQRQNTPGQHQGTSGSPPQQEGRLAAGSPRVKG